MRCECLRHINECTSREPVPLQAARFSRTLFKTGTSGRPYLLKDASSPEVTMAWFRTRLETTRLETTRLETTRLATTRLEISRLAFAVATPLVGSLWVSSAFASQGPGGGPGSASNLTQLVMAIIVYGTAAAVVGAGLIGAARRLP
jgi:hypothetical protein